MRFEPDVEVTGATVCYTDGEKKEATLIRGMLFLVLRVASLCAVPQKVEAFYWPL